MAEDQRFLVGYEGALRRGVVGVASLNDGVGVPVETQLVLIMIEL
jgi:hypothetical protein